MLNPLTGGGGVTVNASQPGVTTGAVGAGGKIILLTILLVLHWLLPVVPAAVPPQSLVNTYCACIV